MLDSFCVATGYGRKYAIKVLKGSRRLSVRKRIPLAQRYGPGFRSAPKVCPQASGDLCRQRLHPFLLDLAQVIVRRDQLIRTLKEQLVRVQHCVTADDLDRGPQAFNWRHNQQWPTSEHDLRAPRHEHVLLALRSATCLRLLQSGCPSCPGNLGRYTYFLNNWDSRHTGLKTTQRTRASQFLLTVEHNPQSARHDILSDGAGNARRTYVHQARQRAKRGRDRDLTTQQCAGRV